MDYDTVMAAYFEQAVYTGNDARTPTAVTNARIQLTNTLALAQNTLDISYEAITQFQKEVELSTAKDILLRLATAYGMTFEEAETGLKQVTFEIFAKALAEDRSGLLRTPRMVSYVTTIRHLANYRERRHRTSFNETIRKIKR